MLLEKIARKKITYKKLYILFIGMRWFGQDEKNIWCDEIAMGADASFVQMCMVKNV